MTGRGKRGKPKSRFPTLFTALGNPAKSSGIPTFPQLRRRGRQTKTPHPTHNVPRWAKLNRRNGPKEVAKSNFLDYSVVELTKQGRGVAQSNINGRILRSLNIPLPPLSEQERIVRILDAAEELRRLRAQADRRTADLIPALFYEMFGNPAANPRGWEFLPLSKLWAAPPNNGIFRRTVEYGEGMPVVWVEELFHGLAVDISQSRRLPAADSDIQKYGLMRGDLLFCRSSLVREGVGQIAFYSGVDKAALFECHLIRLSPDLSRLCPEFVASYFRLPHGKSAILAKARTATMTTIGQQDVASLELPLPPITLQKQFAARVAEIRALEARQAESRRRLDDLFASLLHRAFQGEL